MSDCCSISSPVEMVNLPTMVNGKQAVLRIPKSRADLIAKIGELELELSSYRKKKHKLLGFELKPKDKKRIDSRLEKGLPLSRKLKKKHKHNMYANLFMEYLRYSMMLPISRRINYSEILTKAFKVEIL